MTQEQKTWIDKSDYMELLRRWRFSDSNSNDLIFQGEAGAYYSKVMFAKRDAHEEAAGISKLIGWD